MPLRAAKEKTENLSRFPDHAVVEQLFVKTYQVPPPNLSPSDIDALNRRFRAALKLEKAQERQ